MLEIFPDEMSAEVSQALESFKPYVIKEMDMGSPGYHFFPVINFYVNWAIYGEYRPKKAI